MGKVECWYDSARFSTSEFHHQWISAGDCRGLPEMIGNGNAASLADWSVVPVLPRKDGPCPRTDRTVDFTASNRI